MIEKKSCSHCKETKPVSEFYPSKTLKSGYRSRCKKCDLIGASARAKDWYENNKDRAVETRRKWAKDNKERIRERDRERSVKNRDKKIASQKKYRDANKELLSQRAKERKAENPARRAEILARWAAKNKDKIRAGCSRRRDAIRSSSSYRTEFDKFVLVEAHDLAIKRREITGGAWDVDHVEPLQGKDVCGLNNAFNMAVVPSSFNKKKSNKRIDNHWIAYA